MSTRPVAGPLISASGVVRSFPGGGGVRRLNLEVEAGTIFGLIGPSGCGKTTTVRLLAGLLTPDQGSLQVFDEKPRRFRGRTRERIGYMPQQFVLYPSLTVGENLGFAASLYGLGFWSRRRRMREVLRFVELTEFRGRRASDLSGGMRRRLELACALVHRPDLIFADEPTAGVDPILRGKFWDHFRELRDEGRTLFVTTQYVTEAAYCDLVGVMHDGDLLYTETPDGLRRRALGGQVIRLLVQPEQEYVAERLLRRDPRVVDVRHPRLQPGMVDAIVDSAAETLPGLVQQLSASGEVDLREAEVHEPPFDEVFVLLIQQALAAAATREMR